jgi:hypothetical protein
MLNLRDTSKIVGVTAKTMTDQARWYQTTNSFLEIQQRYE